MNSFYPSHPDAAARNRMFAKFASRSESLGSDELGDAQHPSARLTAAWPERQSDEGPSAVAGLKSARA